MTPGKPGLAPQRTVLAWQRTALDFVVVGGLLLRGAGGWRPLGLAPAALAFGTGAGVLLFVRRRGSALTAGVARALGSATITVALLAGLLALSR